jgi:polyisoprenoid-binding protein YceI
MRARQLILIVTAALVFGGPALAASYQVDPAHSSVNFSVRHIFSKVEGRFKEFSGRFAFDEKEMKGEGIAFTVQAATLDTNEAKRDEHVRGPDFFDAAKYPEASFKSVKVTKVGKNKFKVAGDLTIHGVTRPVTFATEFLGAGDTPWGKRVASFSSSARINRKDFGMVWNKVLDSGALLIGEEVDLAIQVEGIRREETVAEPAVKK